MIPLIRGYPQQFWLLASKSLFQHAIIGLYVSIYAWQICARSWRMFLFLLAPANSIFQFNPIAVLNVLSISIVATRRMVIIASELSCCITTFMFRLPWPLLIDKLRLQRSHDLSWCAKAQWCNLFARLFMPSLQVIVLSAKAIFHFSFCKISCCRESRILLFFWSISIFFERHRLFTCWLFELCVCAFF